MSNAFALSELNLYLPRYIIQKLQTSLSIKEAKFGTRYNMK